MIVFVQSTLTLVSKRNLDFKVTPKSVDSSVYKNEIKSLRLYMVIAAVLTGSMLFGLLEVFSLRSWSLSNEVFIIAFFWAGYNQVIVLLALSGIFEKNHDRTQYRFPVQLSANILCENRPHDKIAVRVKDLSLTGAGLILEETLSMELKNMYLSFTIPGKPRIKLPIQSVHYQSTAESGKVVMGISFSGDLSTYRERLFEYLFVILPPVHLQKAYQIPQWNLQKQTP